MKGFGGRTKHTAAACRRDRDAGCRGTEDAGGGERRHPNEAALQRTGPHVTAAASTTAFPPTMQVPRRAPRSLSLGSLGIATRPRQMKALTILLSVASSIQRIAADLTSKDAFKEFALRKDYKGGVLAERSAP